MMSEKTSIGKSLAWMSASQLLGVVLQFCAQVVLARVLSLHEAGIYAIALAVVSFLSLLQSVGLQAFLVREKHLTPAILATVFTINLAMSLFIAIAILAVGALGAQFLGDPGVASVLYVMALVPLISAASFLPLALLERDGQFRSIALAQAVGNLLGAATTIAMALSGFSYMSASFGQVAMAAAQGVVLIALGRGGGWPRLGFERWREVADFALQMLAISGVSNLGMRLSDIVLGRLLGLSALGLYSRASGLNLIIWSNLHLLAGRVLFVDYAEAHRRGESLRSRYIVTLDSFTALLWPVFTGFATLAGPMILLVFGEKWVPARGALCFLALSSMFQVAITMTNELFAATNQLRIQTRIEFIRAGVALALFVAGCLVSIEAAAAARAAEALFAVMLYRGHINRMTDTHASDLNPIYWRNAAITAMTCLPAVLVSIYWDWSPHMPMSLVFGSAVLGGMIWIACLMLTHHPIWTTLTARYVRRAA